LLQYLKAQKYKKTKILNIEKTLVLGFFCPIFNLKIRNMAKMPDVGGDSNTIVENGAGAYKQIKYINPIPLIFKQVSILT